MTAASASFTASRLPRSAYGDLAAKATRHTGVTSERDLYGVRTAKQIQYQC